MSKSAGSKVLTTYNLHWHYLFAAAVAVGYYFGARPHQSDKLLLAVSAPNRSALYISLTATTGALFGFAITGVTILLAIGGGRRIDWLYQQSEFAYVRTIFIGAIWSLGLATMWFSVMIIIDADPAGKRLVEALSAGVVLLILLRLWVLVRLLSDLLAIAIEDRSSAKEHTNPPFTEPVDEPDQS